MSIQTTVNDFVLFFPKALNLGHITVYATKGGSVVWDNCDLKLNTGANELSAACVDGYLPIYVNQEPKVKVTLNIAFAPPQDGLLQLIGMGDSESGVFAGYDGLKFGMLVRNGGRRQNWVLKTLTACTVSGVITITLLDTVHTVNVTAGMTAIQVMYAIYSCATIKNDNIRCYACFDRLTLYTDASRSFTNVVPDDIDFGTTGVTGSLTLYIAGVPAQEEWTYIEDFNAITRFTVQDVDRTNMNVYEFLFSRWSSGAIHFSMLNPDNDIMTALNIYTPQTTGFNTSRPYMPHVFVKNRASYSNDSTGVVSSSVNTITTSMASCSSGTPSTATNSTWFTSTFTALDKAVTKSSNSVIAMLTVPLVTEMRRNYMTAAVSKITVNIKTPRAVRLKLIVNGAVSALNSTVAHMPWSCVRHATPKEGTTVQGGLEFASLLFTDISPATSFEFNQLWLAPGNNMTVSVASVDDPVTFSIDLTVTWCEV